MATWPRHLDFSAEEHPLALQLGGSEPADLAACARLAARWGYDEINLNCGCPSERVQRGAFGACLMGEPALVADGVKAMRDAVDLPVTVKHRIGIDRSESYDFVRDFVGTVARGRLRGVHRARAQCLAAGHQPEGEPRVAAAALRHRLRLKRDFPSLRIVLNGGVAADAQIAATCGSVDGVMLGREAYHHPWSMASWDAAFLGAATPPEPVRAGGRGGQGGLHGSDWRRRASRGAHATRHMLGLWNGTPGARRWRQVWSDHRLKDQPPAQVARAAQQARGAELHNNSPVAAP